MARSWWRYKVCPAYKDMLADLALQPVSSVSPEIRHKRALLLRRMRYHRKVACGQCREAFGDK